MKNIFLTISFIFFAFTTYKADAQNWLTAGNALTVTGTLGLTTAHDIKFFAKNTQVGYIYGTTTQYLGDFDIGINGTVPENKLLVENGTIYTPTNPYGSLKAILANFTAYPLNGCMDPTEIGTFSYSNSAAGTCNSNQGIIGLADEGGIGLTGFNMGVIGVGNGSGTNNIGGYFFANGPDPTNVGVVNNAVIGFAQGDGAYMNCGGTFQVFGGGGTAAQINAGASGLVKVAGTVATYGLVGDLSALSPSPLNTVPCYAIYALAPFVSSTSATLVNGTNAENVYAGYFDGDIFSSGTYYYSDAKLKDNITAYSGALDKLNQLSIKSYTFKQKEYPTMNFPRGPQIGLLADDLKNVFPNLVKESTQPAVQGKGEKVQFDAVNYEALIPVLIQGEKELDAKTAPISALVTTVAQQQSQIEQLLAQVNSQNEQISDLRNMVNDICNTGCGGLQGNSGTPVTPQDVTLYQSVPNPTSGVATIGYVINIAFTSANINVTSLNGDAVQQFKITQQGKGSITFDGSRYASGTFNYTLYIDGKLFDTKTMVISKR